MLNIQILIIYGFSEVHIMLTLLIILWTISLIIFLAEPKSEQNQCGSLTIFLLGSGIAADLFKEFVTPFISENYPLFLDRALFFNSLLYSISYNLPPYFLLLYSMAHTNLISHITMAKKIFLKLILLIPVLLMYVFVPITPPIPVYNTNFIFLAAWSVPYMLFSYILIITAYFKEKSSLLKLERLVNIAYIIPAYTVILTCDTIVPIFTRINNKYVYLSLVIYLIVCASFLLLKADFFGIRVIKEKDKRIIEKRIFDSSISMLNHAIKNEVSKISICAAYLNDFSIKNEETVKETASIILNGSTHLLEIINNFNIHSQGIKTNNEFINIKNAIEDVISLNRIIIDKKDISVYLSIPDDLNINFDKVHFKELVNNLLVNSIEAIENTGNITIKTSMDDKYIIILVKDTGCGILDKDIHNVTEPFFSTKNSSKNYGVGLYYCKQLINKYGGYIEINNKTDLGTEVFVFLPKKTSCSIITRSYNSAIREEYFL